MSTSYKVAGRAINWFCAADVWLLLLSSAFSSPLSAVAIPDHWHNYYNHRLKNNYKMKSTEVQTLGAGLMHMHRARANIVRLINNHVHRGEQLDWERDSLASVGLCCTLRLA